MTAASISKAALRRFMLGRDGLWPGRRWAGRAGAEAALRQLGSVQLDPLNVVARSHDIVLWGRVVDYTPADLNALLYRERKFFDYGGTLFVRPMDELPYWRVVMRRKGTEPRWAAFAAEHAALLDEVRAELRRRGPLGNRDFEGTARVNSYRARKDTGLALFYLWLTGEVMIHHRRGFQRIYDFRENVAPPEADMEATVEEAEHFFARRVLHGAGLCTAREWTSSFSGLIERRVDRAEAARWLDELVAAGELATVAVEGHKAPCYLRAADLALLPPLEAGEAPAAWQPLGPTTREEVVFLAPLDRLSARGRARVLFDFDYIWEVYKPAAARRWGYYTLPILWGDRLVGRLDPKLERATGTLVINGFWLEDAATADDPAFVAALAAGLNRFADFHGARHLDLSVLAPATFREQVQAMKF